MKRCILSFLVIVCCAFADDQYADDQYPTAKISVMDQGASEGPSNRYALQVSGDQLQDYLKALKQVPDSIYSNGAHIIADMEESSLPESLSSSRYDNDQETGDRDQIDLRSLIPALRLDRQQQQEDPSQESDDGRRRSMIYAEPEESVRKSERHVPELRFPVSLRDLIMRREDIGKSDSPASQTAAAAAAVQALDEQITRDVSEALKEAKAIQAAETETLKEKVVEAMKQKEEMRDRKPAESAKEFATASTHVPEIEHPKHRATEERGDKYRTQESEHKLKAQEKYKSDGDGRQSGLGFTVQPKESPSQELFMSRVQDELNKSLQSNNQPTPYERVNKSDTIDMKTVRELLSTLIKQIENIQSAAKTLTSSAAYPSETKKSAKELKDLGKDYSRQQPHRHDSHRERESERLKKPYRPLPFELLDPYHTSAGTSAYRKKTSRKQRTEKTVYLKPHEVMKLLEPETYETMEVPIRRARPYAMAGTTLRRTHTPYPVRRSMFPSFYPGYKK